ncbi:MAG: RNA methyltransferase [Synechococcus sp. TMED187]|jgi:putative N6-adenine-specific DNA methylase|uniref:THUMP domain-containing class I SAM-dependent RNA methyltransferase n=1 Tax=unclassified Synechococcus TaxID=2626047 RepID=UPI000B6396C1|nr:THUMP domain-containing protein [Synechococcus sp. UW105]OUW48279.1 MAG: RNA methyltransferase [Synechococcus sp. TMED187]|tara:strand:+ start:201 stop:1328 length:1128 start_codon:yes stop_codon:yes gene_type:complete
MHRGIAVLPQGLEEAGTQELIALGAKAVQPLRRAAAFEADKACLYRLHLQCRLPFRLLRELASFPCDGRDSLYHGVQDAVDWERWLHPSMTFRVDATGTAQGLNHSHYNALQVKNAIVDRQRDLWGERSSVDLEEPDLHLHLHLGRGGAVLSLDGCGGSLHRRGYRAAMGAAPLKENLAAGLIRLTNWDGTTPLVDPLCGSGTLLIEAASLAHNHCPGLQRQFSLEGWADFDNELWQDELERAKHRSQKQRPLAPIIGCEQDATIADQARSNIAAAGLDDCISIQTGDFRNFSLPPGPGVVVCNPPYGLRVGDGEDLESLYSDLGTTLKAQASGWDVWVLSGNPGITGALRMKASRRIPISNGGIDCRWLHYQVR